MKLNDIDFDKLSDNELKALCIKYRMVNENEVLSIDRKQSLNLIRKFLERKLKVYGQKKNNDPNLKQVNVRRMSTSGNLQTNTKSSNSPPRPNVQRRMSQPITKIEKIDAVETHERVETKQNSVNHVKQQIGSQNPEYDIIGMYPPVKKLIAIGDLHGDLKATLSVLKLAEVIPQTTTIETINNAHWCGGDTWVIQLGDQIDRCRPDDWEKNCIKDFSDVYEDEGNNMTIIRLLLRLDDEARQCGGRVLGLLGNHEIMNVDKDFRYVSPKEFLEFVPEQQRNSKYTKDGFPLGYYHRTKAFERGSNMAKLYAIKKKSIIMVGSYIFVHGGISQDLARKYTFAEINDIVTKWMCKNNNDAEEKMFDEIFRDDDDMSPFWCRIYAEDDGEGENTEQGFNELLRIINQRNNLITPAKGVVIAHTPQFMDYKYLNSAYNDRLWRIDVGMSRAFGKHRDTGEDKFRIPQVLVIHNDSKFEVRKKPWNTERHPSPGMGTLASLENASFL
tara:strand:+ start:1001 stop:2509 length:1509 start_codon:yes stop_codon:yes gene_type:complete